MNVSSVLHKSRSVLNLWASRLAFRQLRNSQVCCVKVLLNKRKGDIAELPYTSPVDDPIFEVLESLVFEEVSACSPFSH